MISGEAHIICSKCGVPLKIDVYLDRIRFYSRNIAVDFKSMSVDHACKELNQ